MTKKIGEVFIERGLITAEQLEMALKAQLIFGGHLGTCLIELGLIDEDSLGKVLSHVTGVPYAPKDALQDISEWTIKAFPRKLAEEYEAVPLKIANKAMHLAMVNPKNLVAIDEISFAAGHRITPWVSPELRIYQALERYYGVPRRPRYITICRNLEEQEARTDRTQTRGAPAARAHQKQTSRSHRPASDRAAGSPKPAPAAEKEDSLRDLDTVYGYGRSWREIAEEIDSSRNDATATPEEKNLSRSRPEPARPSAAMTVADVAERLCNADTMKGAVRAILDYSEGRMKRCIFLAVNGDMAAIWDSRGDAVPRTSFSVTRESLFMLLQGEPFYRGQLPTGERFESFFRAVGMKVPSDVLLVPIHLNDRLVAIFYGDGGPGGRISGETDEHLRVLRLLVLSLNLILLKQKIRLGARSRTEHGARAAYSPADR